ncbi:MAG: LacI family DNA-binding transcriptional regulator [Planctomycetota bacterium]
MSTAPNVFDIAREAGVSKSTAARALSGTGAVSATARARVLAAAESLKYRVSSVARSLRSGENRLLGVVLPMSGSAGFLSHTISAQKLEGIASAARRLRYDLQIFIENLDDPEALRALSTDRSVRGLFFFGRVARGVLEHLNAYQVPWIGLNWRHVDWEAGACVWTDFQQAGATLAGHLFDQGCRRVLAFDWLSAEYGPYDEGFTQAVFDRNLPYAALEVRTGRRYYDGAPVAAELARAFAPGRAAPDGLVLGSSSGAIAAYRFLARERPELRIGVDVRMATFDDLDKTAALEPGLTAYAQDMAGIGARALETMDGWLAGQTPPVEQRVAGELRVRGSSDAAAAMAGAAGRGEEGPL